MQTCKNSIKENHNIQTYINDSLGTRSPDCCTYNIYNRGLYRSQFPFFFLGKPSVSIISKMDLLTFERLVSKLYFGVTMQG